MNNKDIKKFYKKELSKLRDETVIFSKQYPSLAPMLGEKSNDPDVERLLEGVAYLNAIIQKKLEDDFPELLHELINILFPHYLRPIPSLSIIKFFPDNSLESKITVEKGSLVKSKLINNTKCEFQTCWNIDILPLSISNLRYKKVQNNLSELEIDVNLNNNFNSINADILDFYVNDINLVSLMINNLYQIQIYENNNFLLKLDTNDLINLGFSDEYSILPFPNNCLSNYKLIQEFFLFEDKFKFFKLKNISKLKNKIMSANFSIKFSFNKSYNDIKSLNLSSVSLYCVPIINIFRDYGEPIKVNNLTSEYEITPSWKYKEDYRIYDVIDVSSIAWGVKDLIKYSNFNDFKKKKKKDFLYKIKRKNTSSKKSSEKCFIELFRTEKILKNEVLSLTIDITNGEISENLGLGDICIPTDSSPARTTFENIIIPTAMIESPINEDNLWYLISHATSNILDLNNLERLKELFYFYVNENYKDKTKNEINKRKLDSLIKFEIQPSTHIYKGTMLKGSKINIILSSEYFLNFGEMHLFMNFIQKFFSINSNINTYVELESYDIFTGETFKCKPKIC